MKVFYNPRTRAAALLLLSLTTLIACQTGSTDQKATARTGNKPPLPHMYLYDSVSRSAEANYGFFDTLLSNSIGKPETDSVFYPIQEFLGMIDTCSTLPGIGYLDIFPVVPTTTNTLSLLFVAKDTNYNTLVAFQLPGDSVTFDRQADSVPLFMADAWEKNYKITVGPILNPYLDSTDEYNYQNCNTTKPANPSNTLHIIHKFSDFTELESEITYQATKPQKKDTISGFKAFFATYSKQPKKTQKAFSNRLFAILEFAEDDPKQHNHRKFAIDTSGRKYVGPDYPVQVAGCKVPYIKSGGDNGQMCPPACNP